MTFSASKRVFEGGTLGRRPGRLVVASRPGDGHSGLPSSPKSTVAVHAAEQWHVETVCRAEYMQDHRAGVGHGHRQPGVGDGIGVRERRDADDQVTARPCREQLRFVRTPHSTAAVGL